MNYEIVIERQALRFISRQPQPQKKQLLSAIYRLPYEGDRRALEDVPGLYRLRVGDYRVLYSMEEKAANAWE